MNKVDELIAKLCPDGVEYKVLSEITSLTAGERIIKSMMDDDAKFPVMGGGTLPTGRYDKSNYSHAITISRAGSAGHVNWMENDFWATDVCFVSCQKKGGANIKYVYYCVKMRQPDLKKKIYGGNLPKLNKDYLWSLKIPVPPIEIQNEIVNILDNFSKLEAELEAELEARKQQYGYYLNSYFGGSYSNLQKLADEGKVILSPLEELGTLTRGKRFVRDDIVESGTPCIHYGDLYTYYGISAVKAKSYLKPEQAAKLRSAEKGDVVIVGAGENDTDIGVGVAWFGEENAVVHDACYIFKHNMNPKYVSYFLRSDAYHTQIKKYVSSGKICAISAKGLGKALMPVPSLEEQARIVSILDRFDRLCNDLTEGLPAEIEARRKQYEYYRDRLLTFKPKETKADGETEA